MSPTVATIMGIGKVKMQTHLKFLGNIFIGKDGFGEAAVLELQRVWCQLFIAIIPITTLTRNRISCLCKCLKEF